MMPTPGLHSGMSRRKKNNSGRNECKFGAQSAPDNPPVQALVRHRVHNSVPLTYHTDVHSMKLGGCAHKCNPSTAFCAYQKRPAE